ncbi:MAG: MBL fold metallo-hydrolase [Candidatus Helarchaeota archaeon]
MKKKNLMKLIISIVYDNSAIKKYLKGWGFSAHLKLVNSEKTYNILFDTGADPEILFYNMKKMNINPYDIDSIVISHSHMDHAGGLLYLLGLKDQFVVYIPKFMHRNTKSEMKMYAGDMTRFIEVDGIQKITDNIFTICNNRLYEQFLNIHLLEGILILTGCAHPGLSNIIDFTRKSGTIYGVMGGFHGFSELNKLKDMKFILPCHCTSHKNAIKKMYPDITHECAAGIQYEFGI